MSEKIKVVVEYVAWNENSQITGTTMPEKNNTSTGDVLNPAPNYKPFILGASKLGEGQRFVSRYNGYASRKCSDEEGRIIPPVPIKVTGQNIETLRFKFSESLNQWATEVEFNGQIYQNDGLMLTFTDLDLNATEHTLYIRKWSAPKFNVRIDQISLNYVVEYDRRQLDDLMFGIENSDDETKPRFGLIGQYGDIKVQDLKRGGNFEVKNLAQFGLLAPKSPITLYVYGGKMADFRSEKWKWSLGKISTPLEDESVDLQESESMTAAGYASSKTALALINEISTGLKLDISEKAQKILSDTIVPYSYIGNTDTWTNIQKICEACLLRCWQDKDVVYMVEFI